MVNRSLPTQEPTIVRVKCKEATPRLYTNENFNQPAINCRKTGLPSIASEWICSFRSGCLTGPIRKRWLADYERVFSHVLVGLKITVRPTTRMKPFLALCSATPRRKALVFPILI